MPTDLDGSSLDSQPTPMPAKPLPQEDLAKLGKRTVNS